MNRKALKIFAQGVLQEKFIILKNIQAFAFY